MVAATLRDAISSLASTFRRHDRPSPFHVAHSPIHSNSLLPWTRDLLHAFDKLDPPPSRQKAITPDLLRDLRTLAAGLGPAWSHTTDLIVGAFFFAMRACEFSRTKRRGRTRLLTLGNITFRDVDRRCIPHCSPHLLRDAHFVTICFVDQKNGTKMDRRSQQRTTDKALCPVLAWGRAVQRVRQHNPEANEETPVCALGDPKAETYFEVSDKKVVHTLRTTCRVMGKGNKYGIQEHELGSRSIRSGAAMALFLKNHSVEKIKILGRWSSEAFLVYIRPQVLEWTNNMSQDMASLGKFTDLSSGAIMTSTNDQKRGQKKFIPNLNMAF